MSRHIPALPKPLQPVFNAPGPMAAWESANFSETSKIEEWFTPARFALLSACLIAACFPGVIAGRDTFFFRDFAIFSYPLAAYHKAALAQGEIPLWNPYSNCGLPFLAQWNTMVLYPFSIIYLLLPLTW